MSAYNTGNVVPSTDPRDLDDNATNLDNFVNGGALTYPDRLGVARKSYAGIEADVAGLLGSPNLSALAGLTGSANTLAMFTGAGAMTLKAFTVQAQALLDDTTFAAMRATLGLVKTTSATDTTAGSILQVGDFGVGGSTLPTSADADAIRAGGGYQLSSAVATAAGLPLSVGYTLFHIGGSSGTSGHTQFASPMTSVAGNRNKVFHRQLFSSAWSAWEELAYGGANASITSLTGLTTPLSVAQGGSGGTSQPFTRANSLGTVSQTAGVPTGAIFETGGTIAGSGKYTKYANGDMEIIRTLAVGTGSTTAKGSIFGSAPVAGGAFPVAFVTDLPTVQVSGTDSSGGGWAAMDTFATLTNWGSYSTRNHASLGTTGTIYLTARGKWF